MQEHRKALPILPPLQAFHRNNRGYFEIDDIEVKKQELDFIKIIDYYKDCESLNCHLVVPNYLKLPQALEK